MKKNTKNLEQFKNVMVKILTERAVVTGSDFPEREEFFSARSAPRF